MAISFSVGTRRTPTPGSLRRQPYATIITSVMAVANQSCAQRHNKRNAQRKSRQPRPCSAAWHARPRTYASGGVGCPDVPQKPPPYTQRRSSGMKAHIQISASVHVSCDLPAMSRAAPMHAPYENSMIQKAYGSHVRPMMISLALQAAQIRAGTASVRHTDGLTDVPHA